MSMSWLSLLYLCYVIVVIHGASIPFIHPLRYRLSFSKAQPHTTVSCSPVPRPPSAPPTRDAPRVHLPGPQSNPARRSAQSPIPSALPSRKSLRQSPVQYEIQPLPRRARQGQGTSTLCARGSRAASASSSSLLRRCG